jgi:hypothetical protein
MAWRTITGARDHVLGPEEHLEGRERARWAGMASGLYLAEGRSRSSISPGLLSRISFSLLAQVS